MALYAIRTEKKLRNIVYGIHDVQLKCTLHTLQLWQRDTVFVLEFTELVSF